MNTRTSLMAQWAPHELEHLQRCPACGSCQSTPLYVDLQDHIFSTAAGQWQLMSCGHCTCAFLNPRPTPATIGRAYANYYTHVAHSPGSGTLTVRAWLRRALANGYRNDIYATRLWPSLGLLGPATARLSRAFRNAIESEAPGLVGIRASKPGESLILDMGCGSGLSLLRARDAGWRVMGIEPDAAAAKAAQSRGVDVVASQLDDLPSTFNGRFERVTLSHVIEHVHYPLAILQRCKELLAHDGALWLETPNILSTGHAEFGADWRGLEPPRHLVLFSSQALTALLRRAGFSNIEYSEPRDVWAYMFEHSLRTRHKRLADAERLSASPERRSSETPKSVSQRVREARALVAEDPDRSEFLTLTARL